MLDHALDPNRRGNGPGLKVIKLHETDDTSVFATGLINDTLYLVCATVDRFLTFEFGGHLFRKIGEMLTD